MFDTLNMRVKTTSATLAGSAPQYLVLAYYADDITTSYSFDPAITSYKLPLGGVESIRIYNDYDGVLVAGVDYNIDWQNQLVISKFPNHY